MGERVIDGYSKWDIPVLIYYITQPGPLSAQGFAFTFKNGAKKAAWPDTESLF